MQFKLLDAFTIKIKSNLGSVKRFQEPYGLVRIVYAWFRYDVFNYFFL